MAGPGGGPPRRSHTKSRKGCETCKKRHIRCDESFPQCRNCTKHKIRCPYNDIPLDDRSTTPDKPDLMWTPEIEAVIDQWRCTGIFPFPSLNIYPTPSPEYLTNDEMRLIHHVAAITHQLGSIDANGFTLWTRHIPTIIKIGATNGYVLHALLAFSAMHIAFLTDCPVVGNLGYEHRGIALQGLQEAIGTFSKESSDAILAASLVLSWQATDWRSWTQLMQGTSSVIDAMTPWQKESLFGEFIYESSTFPTAPPSPTPDHKPTQPTQEDLDAFQQTLMQLQKLETHLKHSKEDPKSVAQLTSFLKGARKVSPTLSISQQFERLRPLRTWLFWLPVMYLQKTGGSPNSLVVIAHYYTVALLMERLFPEIGAAYFGSLTIGPVQEIDRRLASISISGSHDGSLHIPLAFMEYPRMTVADFQERFGWLQPYSFESFLNDNRQPHHHHHHSNSYTGISDISPLSPLPPMSTAPTTTISTSSSGYVPYPTEAHPAFRYSTENLSSATREQTAVTTSAATSSITATSTATGTISPITSSPFTSTATTAGGVYLNIPSPTYGGHSPASSGFGDFCDTASIVYSDNDEFGSSYEFGSGCGAASRSSSFAYPQASTPILGQANMFSTGVGTSLSTSRTSTQTFPRLRFSASTSSLPKPNMAISPFLGPEPPHILPLPVSTASYSQASRSLSVPHHRYNTSTASAPPSVVDMTASFWSNVTNRDDDNDQAYKSE